MSKESLSLSDLQRLADDILSSFATDIVRPAAIKKLCEAVKEVATPIPSAPKTWAKPPTAAAIRWMVGEVELDAAFKLRSDRTLLLCSMVREFLKGTADEETEPAAKPMMLRTLIKSQGKPSPFVAKACTTDFWQATGPVPTTTPEALREWLHNNPQLTDDARVKFLLGMCHAALGELIKERDEAKAATARRGGWHADGPAPDDADALCAFIENNHLTHDPLMVDLLTKCRLALQYTGKHIRELPDEHHAVARALRGEHIPEEKNELASRVAALFDKQQAAAIKKDPWQATAPIPEDALALCGFILNNTLTDDQRMAQLLDRCRAMIMQLSGSNKDLIAEKVELESIIGAGYWAWPGGEDQGLSLVEVATKMRARLDQINDRVLPKEVATLEQQIVEAKAGGDEGDGRAINEVFRSAEQLLWTVRALILERGDSLAREAREETAAATLSPEHTRQLAELQRENGRLNEELDAAKRNREADAAEFKRAFGDWKTAIGKITDDAVETGAQIEALKRSLQPIVDLFNEVTFSGEQIGDPVAWVMGYFGRQDAVIVRKNETITELKRRLADEHELLSRAKRRIAELETEVSVAKKHAEEAEGRAAYNESKMIEEGHRVIAAQRQLTELTSLLDQRLEAPLADADRDLSDIDQLLNRTTLLVTLCSGAPWSLSESGDHLVLDADRRLVTTISEPTPGNVETRRYNGEFIAASRGLIVHLVEVCRTLVASVRHLRQSNKTLQSVKRELERKLGDASEELRHAKTLEADLQRTINNLREDLRLAQEGEREACASAEIERAKNISVDDLHRMAPACLSCCDSAKWDSRWKNGRLYMHLFQRSRCLETIQGARNESGEVEAADVLLNLLAVCAHWKLSIPVITKILRERAGLPSQTRDPEAIYLIQDRRSYVGNDVNWWGPNSSGYTCQIDEAGLYTEDFCRRRQRSTDVVWRAADIFPLATRVVDVQRIHSADLKPVVFEKKPNESEKK